MVLARKTLRRPGIHACSLRLWDGGRVPEVKPMYGTCGDNGGGSSAVSTKVGSIVSYTRDMANGAGSGNVGSAIVRGTASNAMSGSMGSVVMCGGVVRTAPRSAKLLE